MAPSMDSPVAAAAAGCLSRPRAAAESGGHTYWLHMMRPAGSPERPVEYRAG